MIPPRALNEATRRLLNTANTRILQGHRLGETDADHVAKLLYHMAPDERTTWIDMGAGFGETPRLMRQQCPDLNFILVNNNYLQIAHSPREFLSIHADMCETPIEDDTADGCMFLYSLCQAEFLLHALAEAARVTKQNGRLFVFDYERVAGDNLLMQQTLCAQAYYWHEIIEAAEVAGWSIETHLHPPGDDSAFREMFDEASYAALFGDLKPVIWTASLIL